MSLDPYTLARRPRVIEDIEKASTRMVCQAVLDFAELARRQFSLASDMPGTVGEDVTRDAMESMGLSRIPTARLIGKIDYKRAAYYFAPAYSVRQAMLVDSKAEKDERRTITIQRSQTSLRVRTVIRGVALDEPGGLDQVLNVDGEWYLATTVFVKYSYREEGNGIALTHIIVACLPNGMLQARYNPPGDDHTAVDHIWGVGRNAPTLGEDFRIRVEFAGLRERMRWRVQTILTEPDISFDWVE